MKVSLRRAIAITAAYAVALHAFFALPVLAAHTAAAADHLSFALCTNAGLDSRTHERLPGEGHAHCLDFCLAAANAAGCDPEYRVVAAVIAIVTTLAMPPAADTVSFALTPSGAHRSRAPPA